MTNHDIAEQQKHEDAQVYGSIQEEMAAERSRADRAGAAYSGMLASLSTPIGCGLIAEAIEQSERAEELGGLIASKTASPTLAGTLLWVIVTDYLRKIAEKESE